MHSIEPSRPRLFWVLSPLMSLPFAFMNRCTVSAIVETPFSFLVELADQGQRERRPHVLEVRAHLEIAPVPAGLALDVLDGDLRRPQRPRRAHRRGRILHVGDVLADPLVQLALQIRPLLPGTDLLALQDLYVMRKPRHD